MRSVKFLHGSEYVSLNAVFIRVSNNKSMRRGRKNARDVFCFENDY